MRYNHKKIESKWQKKWLAERVYEPNLGAEAPRRVGGKPFYNLMMFPYPSAEGLHVGNMYAFTGSDIYGRFKRMQGNDVFEPIGLDGFGIHSENYALKVKRHPMDQAKISEKNFYRQLHEIGNGFAWNEKLETYDPEYYKWTQWIFIQMFKHGLAYRKKQAVNWCPSCLTVLADEQVVGGECERCGTKVVKRDLEQWFFKITKYAEKLLRGLEKLDWSEKIKIAQTNWIGKSEGAFLEFPLQKSGGLVVEVFTTRPDTLFGATFLVLAPENPLITALEPEIKNFKQVLAYVKKAKYKKADAAKDKTKTGVELGGIHAINPANNEKVPVWVSDYVSMDYGAGAIMAVPAHDERDNEFAKKFKLPIREVIEPLFKQTSGPDAMRDTPFKERDAIAAIVKHWKEDKYLCLRWKKIDWRGFVMGGVEEGESAVDAAIREIQEETGYTDVKFVKNLGGIIHAQFYHVLKNENRWARIQGIYFELKSGSQKPVDPKEREIHDVLWLSSREVENFSNVPDMKELWARLQNKGMYAGEGFLINSGKFSGMESEKAKWDITKFGGGKRQTHYHLRDWLISRQRYWGPPIPMIHCTVCEIARRGEQKEMPGWYTVPEKDLPVKLPRVKDFRPKGKGESPLASVKSFYEVKCPKCGAKAKRETDVSDTFLDSAWYYLRYPSVKEKKDAWNGSITKKWLPVHMYIGGAEHAVLHLLYVRFLAKVFHDWGLIDFDEPATTFRAHGLLIREGKKISKSKGNIINPDEFIEKFGADALRMHLMFLGPFEEGGDFRDSGILGPVRFLERVWKLSQALGAIKNEGFKKVIHRTVKKVTEDVDSLEYNTAISTLMICLAEAERSGCSREDFESFLKLLAPFAPHMTEEIWRTVLGNKASIHLAPWPTYEERFIREDTFTLVIQVNGKVRDSVVVSQGLTEAEAKKLALESQNVKRIVGGATIRRVIYVPGRLINIVA